MKEPLKYFLERTTPFGALARFYRERRLKKKFLQWKENGGCLPMTNYGKQRVVIEYIKKFSPAVFIETGTYRGKMIYAVQPYVDEIFSVELDPTHCRRVQRRFAGYSNIHISEGHSGEVLPRFLENLDKRCLFWLDAHYSGGSTAKGNLDTPIMQEMECVLNHPMADQNVLLIDDARLFIGANDYPTLEELESFILGIRPHWTFEVKDDIIRAHLNKRDV